MEISRKMFRTFFFNSQFENASFDQTIFLYSNWKIERFSIGFIEENIVKSRNTFESNVEKLLHTIRFSPNLVKKRDADNILHF